MSNFKIISITILIISSVLIGACLVNYYFVDFLYIPLTHKCEGKQVSDEFNYNYSYEKFISLAKDAGYNIKDDVNQGDRVVAVRNGDLKITLVHLSRYYGQSIDRWSVHANYLNHCSDPDAKVLKLFKNELNKLNIETGFVRELNIHYIDPLRL